MEEIIVLLDYKSTYGSKFNSEPPYSGLDLVTFSSEMAKFNFHLSFVQFSEIDYSNPSRYEGVKILYQSSEANDNFGEYKAFIDDVVYFLKLCGAQLVPDYKFFKAHSNKVFMEMLRVFYNDLNKPKNNYYGSLEDFKKDGNDVEFPIVIKMSHGAQSKGVFKADNSNELSKILTRISKSSFTFKEYFKERARSFKYSNYIPFSINRNKFILQSFTPGMSGDYKVLIFNDIFYLIKRENRPNDFRASGGGYNSYLGDFDIPDGLLDYSFNVYSQFNCPFISLDIGINSNGFNLIEFQFMNFGTIGHSKSMYYLKKIGSSYERYKNDLSIEFLYSYSLNAFFN